MRPDPDTRAKEIRLLLESARRTEGGYQDMQRLLIRYSTERFLYRLGRSRFGDRFILKGAMLLEIYVPDSHRKTRDADFLLFGEYSPDGLKGTLAEICGAEHDDGLTFNPSGITVQNAGATREYPGYAARIPVRLGASNCDILLDIGFGEAVTPPARRITYPSVLPLPRPELRVYALETVIAEKFQAMVHLSVSNSRLKDYHDLAQVARTCTVDGRTLCEAITATFARRRTPIPTETPTGLSPPYFASKQRQSDWRGFLKKQALSKGTSLEEACRQIEAMVMPAARASAEGQTLKATWREKRWQVEDVA